MMLFNVEVKEKKYACIDMFPFKHKFCFDLPTKEEEEKNGKRAVKVGIHE